jgi:ABC-type sugar transport system substrate-binding protein
LLVFVMGCGGDDRGSRLHETDADVAAVIKGLDNPFFVAMRDGLAASARAHGMSLQLGVPADSVDAAGQAARLESLGSPPARCYIVNPIDPANLVPPLTHLPEGTPIVNVDLPVDKGAAAAAGVKITTYIGTDNAAAAAKAADAMARLVPPGAKVAVIAGVLGNITSRQRTAGFTRAAGGRFDVIETVAADFERKKARSAAGDLLAAQPDLDGIFAVNDLMALGAADAVRAAGRRGDVTVVGFDGIRDALDAVQRGVLGATVSQYPYTMGELAVDACLAAADDKRVPATIDAPVAVITKENAAQARSSFPRPVTPFKNPLADS